MNISLANRSESYHSTEYNHFNQDKKILKYIDAHQCELSGVTAHDLEIVFTEMPLTSIRRSLTNLSRRDKFLQAVGKRRYPNQPSTVYYTTPQGENEINSLFFNQRSKKNGY